jgi:hypothetical protein
MTKLGETGCQVTLDGSMNVDGMPTGAELELILCFNSLISWKQPLPLDKFSSSGSIFTVSVNGYAVPLPTSGPITALVLISPLAKTAA